MTKRTLGALAATSLFLVFATGCEFEDDGYNEEPPVVETDNTEMDMDVDVEEPE